jgi:AcrR family transcriptional regulator
MPKISAPTLVLHREARRQELISAALELAMQEGASAVTVSAVAKKAGLARTSIYEYFASSADLIADLVIEELRYFNSRLSQAIAVSDDPFEKIALWLEEGLRYAADGRHMLVKSLNAIGTSLARSEDIAQEHRALIAPLQGAIAATGVKDPRSAGSFLAAVSDSASVRIDAGADPEEQIASAVTFALAGLRALAE